MMDVLKPIRCLLPGYKNARPEDQIKALRETIRRVTATADGKVLINALLVDLKYFDKAESEDERVLCEYAKFFIRERLGIVNTFDLSNAILKTSESLKD
jgi:hypothetical protein